MQSIGDPIKSPTPGAKNHAPLRIADLLSSTNSSPESRISDCAQVNWQMSITPISEAVTQTPSHSIPCPQSNDERNAALEGRSDAVQFRKSTGRKRSSSARSNPQPPLQPKWPCQGSPKAFSLGKHLIYLILAFQKKMSLTHYRIIPIPDIEIEL
jgi:hypothetical protein